MRLFVWNSRTNRTNSLSNMLLCPWLIHMRTTSNSLFWTPSFYQYSFIMRCVSSEISINTTEIDSWQSAGTHTHTYILYICIQTHAQSSSLITLCLKNLKSTARSTLKCPYKKWHTNATWFLCEPENESKSIYTHMYRVSAINGEFIQINRNKYHKMWLLKP